MGKDTEKKEKKITSRQVIAMGGVILLVLLYVITLITALTADSEASVRMFVMCLFATIAVPILIWIYTWIYGQFTGKRTVADMQPDTQAPSSETSGNGEAGTTGSLHSK